MAGGGGGYIEEGAGVRHSTGSLSNWLPLSVLVHMDGL